MHIRAALRNGLTADEIREVLLHSGRVRGRPRGQRGVRGRAPGARGRGRDLALQRDRRVGVADHLGVVGRADHRLSILGRGGEPASPRRRRRWPRRGGRSARRRSAGRARWRALERARRAAPRRRTGARRAGVRDRRVPRARARSRRARPLRRRPNLAAVARARRSRARSGSRRATAAGGGSRSAPDAAPRAAPRLPDRGAGRRSALDRRPGCRARRAVAAASSCRVPERPVTTVIRPGANASVRSLSTLRFAAPRPRVRLTSRSSTRAASHRPRPSGARSRIGAGAVGAPGSPSAAVTIRPPGTTRALTRSPIPACGEHLRRELEPATRRDDERVAAVAVILDDPAVADPHRSVGDRRARRVVGDDDHGGPVAPARAPTIRPRTASARGGVELAGRLIGEQQLRPVRERGAQRDALALAAGELGGEGVDAVVEAGGARAARAARARAASGTDAAERERQSDGVRDPKVRRQHRARVLRRGSRSRVWRRRARARVREPPDVLAEHADHAGRRRLEPGDHAQQRALAGAARPEHADDLAARCASSVVPWSAAASPSSCGARRTRRAASTQWGAHRATLPARSREPARHRDARDCRDSRRHSASIRPRRDRHQRRLGHRDGSGGAHGRRRRARSVRARSRGPGTRRPSPASSDPHPQLATQACAGPSPCARRSRSTRSVSRGSEQRDEQPEHREHAGERGRRDQRAEHAAGDRRGPESALDVGRGTSPSAARAARCAAAPLKRLGRAPSATAHRAGPGRGAARRAPPRGSPRRRRRSLRRPR